MQLAGVGLKIELQAIGAQGLLVKSGTLVQGVGAVLAVAQQGVTDAGQVGADLMGAPRQQMDLQQG